MTSALKLKTLISQKKDLMNSRLQKIHHPLKVRINLLYLSILALRKLLKLVVNFKSLKNLNRLNKRMN
jgi:hypothetical protein